MPQKMALSSLRAAAFLIAAGSIAEVSAQGAPPTQVGAWFGIARPCTPARFPVPLGTDDQVICRLACFGRACPQSNFPVDEVTMIPTLLADGTVLADDFAELLDHHTTGMGKWEFAGTVELEGKKVDRYQASFIWFQPRSPFDLDPKNPLSIYSGVVRPRFVTYFDKDNPDVMRGYIQPYNYVLTDRFGIVNMERGTPFPSPDPLARLPVECNPAVKSNPYCLGTLHFVIRRIPAH